jgi:biopolymer transport protein ExbD
MAKSSHGYDVLTDWLQQGRVTAGDKLRTDGSGDWRHVADVPGLAAFLPRAEADQPNDVAEAFEPVALAMPIRRRAADDDDDVDMIPLIDISLVLLIFFMMTATVAISGASIETPAVFNGTGMTTDPLMIWIGIDRVENGSPVYSIGQGDSPPEANDKGLTLPEVIERLDGKIKSIGVGVPVRIAGNKRLPFGAVQTLTAELEKRRGRSGVTDIKAEVNEKSS